MSLIHLGDSRRGIVYLVGDKNGYAHRNGNSPTLYTLGGMRMADLNDKAAERLVLGPRSQLPSNRAR